MNDAAIAAAYATLFQELEQLGPTTDTTRKAVLALIRDRLPVAPAIADLGCGKGPASLFLARHLPGAMITAIDTQRAFLDALRQAAAAKAAAITTREGDMLSPPLDPASLDLVWCDSAVYAIGRKKALDAWRKLLRPRGLIAFSDVTWSTDDPPEATKAFWASEYPAMTTTEGVEADIQAAGCRLVTSHQSPQSDWQVYYQPLRQRLQTLRPTANDTLAMVLDSMAQEIAIFDAHADCYASVYFIIAPS